VLPKTDREVPMLQRLFNDKSVRDSLPETLRPFLIDKIFSDTDFQALQIYNRIIIGEGKATDMNEAV
jgi:hypothetical protein